MCDILKSVFFCSCCREKGKASDENPLLIKEKGAQTATGYSNNGVEHQAWLMSLRSRNPSVRTVQYLVESKGVMAGLTKSSEGKVQASEFCVGRSRKYRKGEGKGENESLKGKRSSSLPSNTNILPAISQESVCSCRMDGGDLVPSPHHHYLRNASPTESAQYISANAPLWRQIEEINMPSDERPPNFN